VATASSAPLPHCRTWLVSPLDLPPDWPKYAQVAISGPETVLDRRSTDHYVDELVDVPLGPFVLRYWHGSMRPTEGTLSLREATCDGGVVDLRQRGYWTGGAVRLRERDGLFVLSSASDPDEVPIAVVRRLRE
jgi:hypothetical protein